MLMSRSLAYINFLYIKKLNLAYPSFLMHVEYPALNTWNEPMASGPNPYTASEDSMLA